MDYQTFDPHPNLATIIKCYWTLEVPAQKDVQRQLVLPDGCLEMCFILADDVKRYTSEDTFIIQPRQMVLGQITKPLYIEPTGIVNTFSVRFYPYGFSNILTIPVSELSDKELSLSELFDNDYEVKLLGEKIIKANFTAERIEIIEKFLFERIKNEVVIHNTVKKTIDLLFASNGVSSINTILKDDLSKRRQLERNFKKQIGISPKQLGKVIRLQTTLQMLLNSDSESLTKIAYDSDFFDQAHFIKDFKKFTGITPKDFLKDQKMALSALLYKKD